jgi:hypothetical protein
MLFLVLALWGTTGWGAPPPPPATVAGTGTSSVLNEGPYPGLTFESSAPVQLMLKTQTGFVTMLVQADAPPVGEVAVTLRGLPADSFWYLYVDTLANPRTLTADASGAVTFPLDLSQERYLSLQSTHSTYWIYYDYYNKTGGDCPLIGTWDQSRLTCTLDRDIDDSIYIGAGSITIEGAGHTIHNSGYGVYAGQDKSKPGVRIRNLTIDGGYEGIFINRMPGSTIENVTIRNANNGITVYNGGSVTIRDTQVTNVGWGIDIRFAGGNLTRMDIGPVSGLAMYMWYAGGTITDSVIHDCPSGLFAYSFSAYNNIFRDCGVEVTGMNGGSGTFNTAQTAGVNIVGGPFLGGNYYTKSDGTGFSDTARDVNPHDGFADQPYVFGPYAVDNLPLVVYQAYVNYPPVLAPIGDQAVAEGQALSFTLAATDPNAGETLTFSAANLPPGATFDPATATFTWTPGYDQAGTYGGVEFTVTDSGSPLALDVEIISITVGNTNRPPAFDPVGPQAVNEYSTLTFKLWATDPDNDAVSLQAGTLPRGAAFDPATGVFAWRPDGTQTGVHPVYFYAVDDGVPPLTSEMGVVVTVGQVTSPVDLVRTLIAEILIRNLPEPVVNSYLANLKKVEIFIAEGKLAPAINQVEAFIQKCSQDVEQGIIPRADGEYLLMIANDLLALLQG